MKLHIYGIRQHAVVPNHVYNDSECRPDHPVYENCHDRVLRTRVHRPMGTYTAAGTETSFVLRLRRRTGRT